MKDKINKLLNSPIYEDNLLGIELAYDLPFLEFDRMFYDQRRLGHTKFPKIHRFGRGVTDYHIICTGRLINYGPTKYIYTQEELKNNTYPGWINLGYKEN